MPSVTIWSRIEPRCRAVDVQPGLEARVHDPLWLLARQWQIGEFEGRDAGSPVVANIQSSIAPLDTFSAGTAASQAYDGVHPIEALVEREQVRPLAASTDLRQAAEAGLHFLRLLTAAQLPSSIFGSYLTQYPIATGAASGADAQTFASVVAGRVIDGVRLHADLIAAGNNLPPLPAIPTAQHDGVFEVTRTWLAWYDSVFDEAAASGWSTDRMEYQFAMAAAEDSGSYAAQEYDGGSVDWYTFDRSSAKLTGGSAQTSTSTQSQIPTPVTFLGMPAPRYWEFEDSRANIGSISAAAEDIGRLLLREFALIYGNDWFQFALVAPIGCQYLISSLSVADTFGLATAIPHYMSVDGVEGKWRMFAASADALSLAELSTAAPQPHPLLLTPGAAATTDSAAIEDVLLTRDEMANVVWGIERNVVGASGAPLDRAQAWNTSATASPLAASNSVLQYRLGSSVPDYWIPFLPVVVNSAGRLQLRRGRLPTAATGPLGQLLGDSNSTIFLEEVPREGVHLERRYRYGRGPDGSTYLWIGRRRSIGSGEGRSGLRFDFLE
jgi:hypothetical protein